MKVTKLKQGYRIRLSDSEFEVLDVLVDIAKAEPEYLEELVEDHAPAFKAAFNKTFNQRHVLCVDEDRRQ